MKDLIYNQTRIPKEQWRYGLRCSAKVGCGWVATYNALLLMGYRTDIKRMIRSYERQLPILNGNLGTVVYGPALMLKKWGFPVKMTAITHHFDELCRESDAAILFYYWRSGWKIGSHFVAVQYTEKGFVGYNTFKNSDGPDYYGGSLEAFLKKQGYWGTVLIGIKKK